MNTSISTAQLKPEAEQVSESKPVRNKSAYKSFSKIGFQSTKELKPLSALSGTK